MKIDWYQVACEYWQGNETKLEAICKRVVWEAMPCKVAYMPGKAIEALIKQFHIPSVSHIAVSADLAPFGLIGVRAHYKNAEVDIFAVDEGSSLCPLCGFVKQVHRV